jgi:hypothetical protein
VIQEDAESVADVVEMFLFRHLLHWLECMSILGMLRTAVVSVLHLLNRLFKVCDWWSVHFSRFDNIFSIVVASATSKQVNQPCGKSIAICPDFRQFH